MREHIGFKNSNNGRKAASQFFVRLFIKITFVVEDDPVYVSAHEGC